MDGKILITSFCILIMLLLLVLASEINNPLEEKLYAALACIVGVFTVKIQFTKTQEK